MRLMKPTKGMKLDFETRNIYASLGLNIDGCIPIDLNTPQKLQVGIATYDFGRMSVFDGKSISSLEGFCNSDIADTLKKFDFSPNIGRFERIGMSRSNYVFYHNNTIIGYGLHGGVTNLFPLLVNSYDIFLDPDVATQFFIERFSRLTQKKREIHVNTSYLESEIRRPKINNFTQIYNPQLENRDSSDLVPISPEIVCFSEVHLLPQYAEVVEAYTKLTR